MDETTDSEFDSVRDDDTEDEVMDFKEAFSSEAFNRLLKRITSLEKTNQDHKLKIATLDKELKKEKEAASKRITSITNKVNQLTDQVRQLESLALSSAAPAIGATLDRGKCWLSSAEKLGLKKSSTEILKPSQMEVKITNAILSEQADRDRRKRNVLILGVIESISNLSTENERKDEVHKMDKEKVDKVLHTIGANKSIVVSIV